MTSNRYKVFHKKTMTYTYLLPTLYNELPNFKELYNNTENCYLGDNQDMVCITKDNKHITHKVPDRFIDDYENFKSSKYSKFSGEHKLNITKAHMLTDEDMEYNVLFKTNKAKYNYVQLVGGWRNFNELASDTEYWYLVNTKKESYNYNK